MIKAGHSASDSEKNTGNGPVGSSVKIHPVVPKQLTIGTCQPHVDTHEHSSGKFPSRKAKVGYHGNLTLAREDVVGSCVLGNIRWGHGIAEG